VAFIFGAVILIDTETPGFGVPIGLIAGIAIASALVIAAIVGVATKTYRRRVVIGDKELIGKIAEVQADTAWVRVHGENWRVVSATPLHRAQMVKVLARRGLVLDVVPLTNHGEGE
jgi:membrane-bound serine protease (ClpP class)